MALIPFLPDVPAVIAELSWRQGLRDFVMPYELQKMRSRSDRVAALEAQVKELSTRATTQQKEEEDAPILGPGGPKLITASTGYGGGMNGGPPMGMQPTGFMGAPVGGMF